MTVANFTRETIEAVEGRVVYYTESPISFDAFLEQSGKADVELVNGVMVEQMAAQLEHEKLFGWLSFLLRGYVSQRALGIVLGSRTAVEINEFGGRIPDLLFVRQERMHIVRPKAIYGPPDLVVEIVSPNDRPSDIIGLETDYRSIAVPEIWFLDPQKQSVLVLRKPASDYTREEMTTGPLRSETITGFELQVQWLFQTPRPNEFQTLLALLS